MTVYREYGDAPTLWRSLLTEEISEVVAAADQAALAAARNGRERLVAAIVEAVSRLADHPAAHAACSSSTRAAPAVRRRAARLRPAARRRRALRRCSRRASHDGSDRATATFDAAAHLLLLLAQSLVFSARVAPGGGRRRGRARVELRRMLDGYLQPAPPARMEPASSTSEPASAAAQATSPAAAPPPGARRSAVGGARRARRRRRHHRCRCRARRRQPRPVVALVEAQRPGVRHQPLEQQARPRRAALPGER